jgi:hypothetical protein
VREQECERSGSPNAWSPQLQRQPGPLTALEIAKQFPTLGISLATSGPHVRGKIREYLPLPAPMQLSVVFGANY